MLGLLPGQEKKKLKLCADNNFIHLHVFQVISEHRFVPNQSQKTLIPLSKIDKSRTLTVADFDQLQMDCFIYTPL